MFCDKCGKQLEEGTEFCSECGAAVTQEQPANDAGEKKNKSKKVGLISAIAAAVVVLFVLFNWASVSNFFAGIVMSPENYLVKVVSKNFINPASGHAADAISELRDSAKKGTKAEVSMNIKLDNKVLQKVLDDVDVYYDSEAIDWLNSAAIDYTVNVKDNKISFVADMAVNKTDLLSMKFVGLPETGENYISLPGLADQYIMVEGDSIDDYSQIMSLYEAMPKESVAKKLIKNYLVTIVDSVEDVDKTTTTINADGISQKVTELSFDVDGKLIKDIAVAVLTEMKSDSTLKKVATDIAKAADVDTDDVDEAWEAIEELLDELDNIDEDDFDVDGKVKIYVNGKGDIVGFVLRVGDDYSEVEMTSLTAQKGNKFGSLVEICAEDTEISIEGSGKISGNKRSGNFVLMVESYGIKADVLNFETKKVNTKLLEDGIFNGTVKISLPDGLIKLAERQMYGADLSILSDLSFVITSTSKSTDKFSGSVQLNYNDKTCVKVDLTAKTGKSGKIEVPSKYVDGTDYDEIEEWRSDIKFDALLKKMRKAKFPSDLVDDLEESIEYYR